MNTSKKAASFENIASAITNKGDSENKKNKQTKNNNNNNNNNIRVHPTGFTTMTLWFTNADRSSMTRRDDSAGVNWLKIIHTGQHRKMAFLYSNS